MSPQTIWLQITSRKCSVDVTKRKTVFLSTLDCNFPTSCPDQFLYTLIKASLISSLWLSAGSWASRHYNDSEKGIVTREGGEEWVGLGKQKPDLLSYNPLELSLYISNLQVESTFPRGWLRWCIVVEKKHNRISMYVFLMKIKLNLLIVTIWIETESQCQGHCGHLHLSEVFWG